jgi:hypothetical protein
MDWQRMTSGVYLRAWLALWVVCVAVILAAPGPAAAAPLFLVRLGAEGSVPAGAVAQCVAGIGGGRGAGPRHVVVLLHGYDTGAAVARDRYEQFAARLRRAGGGEETALLGVCWPSRPGPDSSWVVQAALHQALDGIGLGEQVSDPYRRTAWRAQRVGRQAVRQLVFAVQAAYPGAAVHLVAHSMGAKAAMSALAPDLLADGSDRVPAFAAGRELQVESVVLAGADLDGNLFLHGARGRAASAALPRARLWWFTVAGAGRKDRALNWRRVHVGTRAIGNCGPRFKPADTERLLRERRLVIDMGRVPPSHAYTRYFSLERVANLAVALDQVAPPAPEPEAEAVAGFRETVPTDTAPAAANDLLGRLDQVLSAPSTPAALQPYLRDPAVSVRLYAAWRLASAPEAARPVFRHGFTVPRALAVIARAQGGEP